MLIQPYLSFEGRCDEAIAFYQAAIGATVAILIRFKEAPDQSMMPPGSADKVMHATLQIGEGAIMMSDGHCSGKAAFQGISLSATVADDAEAARVFAALAEGGQVMMPLTKTFFSPNFGMLSDRFGITWMVYMKP